MEYNIKNQKIINYLFELTTIIDSIGSTYNKMVYKEMGIVKITYMTIAEKVLRNFNGIQCILESEYKFLENNRQPIMLLLRGIIEDLIIGANLIRYSDDELSFTNELNVINKRFAKCSEFLIKKEPYLSSNYNNYNKEELENLVNKMLVEFQNKYPTLYKSDLNGNLVFKSIEELRETSDPVNFKIKAADGQLFDWKKKDFTVSLLHELIELVGFENNDTLKAYNLGYLVYKVLSQYQHFSLDVTINVLNSERDFEISVIDQSIGVLSIMLHKQLEILGLNSNELEKLTRAYEKYII